MKRTPLRRKTPMKRSQKPMKRTPLKRQSSSKSAKEKRKSYASAKKEYMEGRKNKHHCERCEGLIGIERLDLHHKAGRSGSSENELGEMERNLTNKATFMAVCRNCHDYIHKFPKEAREKGWLI